MEGGWGDGTVINTANLQEAYGSIYPLQFALLRCEFGSFGISMTSARAAASGASNGPAAL